MAKNIRNAIENRMDTFSKGQKRIARYILDHGDKAAYLTASKLGEVAQVSESTVVRFASELGYHGYPGMQRALQELARSRLSAAQRFQEAGDRFSGPDLPGAVFHADAENLRRAALQVDRDAFDRAVERIMNARHVYILGVRSSFFVAGYLHFYLHLLFEKVTLVQSNAAGEIFEQLFRIGPEDVLLAISFPRYSAVTVSAVQFARDRGASIVAVTDNVSSPLCAFSDAPVLIPCGMLSFVDSMAAPLSLMNALLIALSRRMGADVSAIFSDLEDIWNEYGIFGKLDGE